jgi:hypothetical protein
MKRTALWLLLLTALVPRLLTAQAQHLEGSIDIDMPRGMISGDVCLSGLPELSSYTFVLNKGLNIHSIRDAAGKALGYDGYEDGKMVGEGLLYTLQDSLPAPRTLCVRYTGAFPVYDGTFNLFDFKGYIAFNGKTLRAAEQSKWYPILYDPASERLSERVSYRLRVRCPACASVYVNGSRPGHPAGAGSEVELTAASPYALLLLAGDFTFREMDGTLFLNSDISETAARQLGAGIATIQRFYEGYLSIPYGGKLVLMEHRPVREMKPKSGWAFVTYPTFAFAGIRLGDMVDPKSGELTTEALGFIGHEAGHYYFGSLLEPAGPYHWFFLESMAEFLSLKLVENVAGEEAYRKRVAELVENLAGASSLTPLDRVDEKTSLDESWRYLYGPLLLVALEREIGKEKMGSLLAAVVTAPATEVRDYAMLRRTALRLGVPEAAWQRFEQGCVRAEAQAACLQALAQ